MRDPLAGFEILAGVGDNEILGVDRLRGGPALERTAVDLLEAGTAIVLAAVLVCVWVFMWVVTP